MSEGQFKTLIAADRRLSTVDDSIPVLLYLLTRNRPLTRRAIS